MEFKCLLFYWILFVISMMFTFITCGAASMCSSNSPCPEHKPYCTPVGCVFECPAGYSINGSSCVTTCGEWYINENRQCTRVCLGNFFVREKVKLIGSESYLEKQCVQACKDGEYIYNGTCVEACPIHFKYITDGSCLERCPETQKVMVNFTIGNLLYHNCVRECPMFEENAYCTKDCSKNKVIFNSKCLDNCPKSHTYLNSNMCIKKCPWWTPYDVNGKCTWRCPNDLPFIFKSTCVKNCSEELPIVHILSNSDRKCVNVCLDYLKDDLCYQICPDSMFMYNGTCLQECPETAPLICDGPCGEKTYVSKMCVEKCPPNMYLYGRRCVFECPFLSYNRTCIDSCPVEIPYLNNRTYGDDCHVYLGCRRVIWYLECSESCEDNTFMYSKNNTRNCIDICPGDTVLQNTTCVHSCSDETPYVQNETLVYKKWVQNGYHLWNSKNHEQRVGLCVRECKESNFYLNYTCVELCPGENDFSLIKHDSEQHYVFNKTCVPACPKSHPLVGNTTWYKYCYGENTVCVNMKWFLECFRNCPDDTYFFENRCVSFCPLHLFIYRNTCVSSCPPSSDITRNLKVSYWKNGNPMHLDNMILPECVSSCDESLIFNSTCVDFCPLEYKYVTNGSCQDKTCDTKFKYHTQRGLECRDYCPAETYTYNSTCVNSCPNALISGTDCAEACSLDDPYRYQKSVKSVTWWYDKSKGWKANSTTVVNFVCTKLCPDIYVLDLKKKLCVNKCPEHSNYIYKRTCLYFCPEKTVFLKSKKGIYCLDRCKNEMFVGENQTCVSKCPDHIKYYSDSVCYAKCPSTKPFALDTNECINRCKDSDEVYKSDEKTCIWEYWCKNPYFVFARQCVKECPEGYKWFLSCYHEYAVITAIVLLTLIIFAYIFHCRLLFKELYNFLCRYQMYKSTDDSQSPTKVLQVQTDTFQPEENIEMDDIVIAETNVFKMFDNNCYINDNFEVDSKV